MLDSHLTTCILQAVNTIRYFLHYFTSERLFLSPQFEKKKCNKESREKRTWTGDHSLKNLRSIHLGLATCEFTIAGGKSIKPFRTEQPRTTCTSIGSVHRNTTLSSHTSRVKGQVCVERAPLPGIRLRLCSLGLENTGLIIPSPYWPWLRFRQYVGSENNRRYFLGLGK